MVITLSNIAMHLVTRHTRSTGLNGSSSNLVQPHTLETLGGRPLNVRMGQRWFPVLYDASSVLIALTSVNMFNTVFYMSVTS